MLFCTFGLNIFSFNGANLVLWKHLPSTNSVVIKKISPLFSGMSQPSIKKASLSSNKMGAEINKKIIAAPYQKES